MYSPLNVADSVNSPLSDISEQAHSVAQSLGSPFSPIADDSTFYSAPEQLQDGGGVPTSPPPSHSTVEDLMLATAVMEAEAMGSKLPLIKENLRHKIQSSRRQRGLEEMQVEMKQQGPEKLTPLDEERRSRRRASNRKAANKCREKKKKLAEELALEHEKIKEENAKLKQEVKELKARHDGLVKILHAHKEYCQLEGAPGSDQPLTQPVGFSASSGVDTNMIDPVGDAQLQGPVQAPLLSQLEDDDLSLWNFKVLLNC